GDAEVDELIQNTQREATSKFNFLEWIPYESLLDVKQIGKGGFGLVYSAKWVDGPRSKWCSETKTWARYPGVDVALKCLVEGKPNKELFEEILSHLAVNKGVLGRNNTLRIYGLTRNPQIPDKFMMVMTLGDEGDLRSFINKNFPHLDYLKKLEILFDIITGILQIHRVDLVHRDLHCANIMCQRFIKPEEGRDDRKYVVGDLGLTRNVLHKNKHFYGRISYCAPEVLESQKFSKASDIYSFGIIMWELVTGQKPFANIDQEVLRILIAIGNTPINISEPKIDVHFPPCYELLMKQCWNREPEKRPSAQKIYETIGVWLQTLMFAKDGMIAQEFSEANKKRPTKIPEEAGPQLSMSHPADSSDFGMAL
ncbi:7988_t:CDS:2, partial [Acaulospora colombiana]